MAGERTLPGIGLRAFWTPGSNGWQDEHDPDTRVLSVLVQCSVIGRVTAVPGSPTDGDVYILTDDPNDTAIAVRDNGAWVYLTPMEGWRAFDKDTSELLIFDGTAWVVFASGAESLADLLDVDLTGLADGNIIIWDDAAGLWVPSIPSAVFNTILSGTAAPTTEGADGDYYVRTTTNFIYGPKAGGVWPAGAAMVGVSFPAYTNDNKTASYVAVSGDFAGNKAIKMTVASTNTFTVNTGITGIEPVSVIQMGAGQTTIVAGSGVTINSSNGLNLRAQYSVATLIPVGTDAYVLSGDTVP